MKRILSEYIPLRHAPLALGYSTLWVIGLGVFGYPMDEALAVTVIAYLTMLVSRLVIANLNVFLLKRLHSYAVRVADRLGIETPERIPNNGKSGPLTAIPALFLVAVILSILGLSLILTDPIVVAMELSPLNLYFNLAGLVMLGAGMTMLVSFFAGSYLLFKGAEVLSNKLSSRVNDIEQSELLVRRWSARPVQLATVD